MESESGNKLDTRIMIVVVLLVTGLIGAGSITPKSDQIVTACYGTDQTCDYYSLECNSSARILLGTLQYGSKNDSVCRDNVQSANKPGHCNHTKICCSYQPGDCAVEDFTRDDTYKAYYNCSGKAMCMNIQSPWGLLQTCSESTYSSYVTLTYTCIKDSSIMQLNEESFMTINSSFIQFDGTRNISFSSKSRNCSCEIVGVGNDSNNITVEIKDVRLSRPVSVNNKTICSSARLFIGDFFQESCNRNASHDNENFVNGKRLYFNVTSNSALRIRLEDVFLEGVQDIPAMVWLYIEALSPINISCNSQPPSPLTTLAPTETTSTTVTTVLDDVTTTEAVVANESSKSTQTSFQTTWNSSDTTLLSTTFGETTYHTNANDNLTTLSTASSSSTTNTLNVTSLGSSSTTNTLNVTSQDLNSTSGTTQTQAGIVSQAWVYAGIGIGVGVLIVLVLSGVIIYVNRSLAHSYKLHSTANGHMLKDKGSDDRMSSSRMAYIDSSDF
ncbi:hypothetical protein ACJMK2_029550 [Sinanodonta woodiana]|uniref:Uncharacterized protein n=1 Tax=Sinanodonta woodiana TaxID=1069815 RepID=A0ABD3XE56_SINWO